jgi:hypothetical protein
MAKSKLRARVRKIDMVEINQQLAREPKMDRIARGRAVDRFDKAKSKLIEEYSNHPVTQEIIMGPRADNISNTLGGYGNIFSFFGFNAGDDPANKIYELLQSFRVKNRQKPAKARGKKSIIFSYPTTAPSYRELEAQTPLPWENKSWLTAVSAGLSGFGHYVSSLKKRKRGSRSEYAVQSTKKFRTGKFRTVSYFQKMYNNFIKNLGQ